MEDLRDTFNEAELEALRTSIGKSKEGTKALLRVWKNRKFIDFNEQTGLYTKTPFYLNRKT